MPILLNWLLTKYKTDARDLKKIVEITSDAYFTLKFVDLGNFQRKIAHSKIHPMEMKKRIFNNFMPA